MAKIYLEATDTNFNVNASNETVYGIDGVQALSIASGVHNTVVDQNVERLVFQGATSDFRFMQNGNTINIYSAGLELVAKVAVQGDADGTQLTFTNGTVNVLLSSATHVMTLGGTTVDALTAAAVTPTTIDASINSAGTIAASLRLTTAQDSLQGDAGANLFTARIFDTHNTLQSGDYIDGLGGTDRLFADIGTSQEQVIISPETANVEQVAFRAQSRADITGDNNIADDMAQIDAQYMVGVKQWESNNSRADVVVEDVRILDSEITKDITIAMVETDPGNVDFGVYFDQYSLRNVTQSSSVLRVQLMDTRAADDAATAATPLLSNPYNGFTFKLNGTMVSVGGANALGAAIDAATTYPQLLAAIEAAVAANPALAGFTVTMPGTTFLATDTLSSHTLTGQEILLNSNGHGTITTDATTGWTAAGSVPSSSGLHTNITTATSTNTDLVTSTIILDDVGRGSTGGDLVVGGLSVGDTSNSRGVERFEIEVRDNSKLQTIASTNNTLEEVTIKNGVTSSNSFAYVSTVKDKGDLSVMGTVDNIANNEALPGSAPEHDSGYGFTDVRLIDASAMTGDLHFTAGITDESFGKYLNLGDTQANPVTDQINFIYNGGAGNDTMAVEINAAIAASNNHIEAGREDFTFTINGGAGNDTIETDIVDNTGALIGNTEAWYTNQRLNDNITIDGGEGNDTIKTYGAGDLNILGGGGDDAIYADNTGAQAGLTDVDKGQWVFNTTNQLAGTPVDRQYDDLLSDTNESYHVYKGVLTVNFKGYEVQTTIADSDYHTTDLEINQAIKALINGNEVLNKLLVATDGPANTLVVTSLIDGTMVAADLTATFAAPLAGVLSVTEIAAAAAAYGLPVGTSEANLLLEMTGAVNGTGLFTANADYVAQLTTDGGAVDVAGLPSTSTSDNEITGGAGNDVIVLGTTDDGLTTLGSSNELVHFAAGFGSDVLVNFDVTAGVGADVLDFAGAAWAANTDNTGGLVALLNAGDATFVSFAGLDAAITGAQTYGTIQNLTLAELNEAFDSANGGLVTTVQNYLVLVQNDADVDGDTFKVFNLVSNASTTEFTSATYMGEIEVLGVTAADFALNAASIV